MSKKTLFLLLVCSVALNLGVVGVYAFNIFTKPMLMPPADCPVASESGHWYTALGLNQTQLDRIEPLALNFHKQEAAIMARIFEQRDRMAEEIARETVDREAIKAIHRDIAVRQSEMQELMVNHILDMKEVMNPEQRQRFFETMQRSFKNQL
jgi:Spy/CpxP family protein refolding chaperone